MFIKFLQMSGVILKKGKEKILKQRHHWIFSGAIDSFPKDYVDGHLIGIYSSTSELLGYGYFNRKCSLAGRVVSFGSEDPYLFLKQSLERAIVMRSTFFADASYRLVNGEGDLLPGLIIDKYGSYLVLQIGTLGMEFLKSWIVDQLRELLPIAGIYEKSTLPTRKEEGLEKQEGLLWGEVPNETEIEEEGVRLKVDLKKGQKTGFFLDQREMRKWIGTLSRGKRVLNTFCYSGGFTLQAMKNQASRVDSVDISADAIELCKKNVALNGFSLNTHGFYAEDVFTFLKEKDLDYDIVILDPPAFAKKKGDIVAAARGYKEINRVALKKMPPKSILLTCSCSYHMGADLFRTVVFQAALEAKRSVKVIGEHRLAVDHPINLYHPESNYLKSLLLYVD